MLDYGFLAEAVAGADDFAISEAGSRAMGLLGLERGSWRLSKVGKRRIAARLRRLFSLVIEYGEPVLVRFVDRKRGFEVLAAPVDTVEGETAIFCTLALDELSGTQAER